MKRVTFEEHFSTEEHLDCLRSILEKKYPVAEVIQEEKILDRELPFLVPTVQENVVSRLYDIGEGRLWEMDEAGIDMQVLSLISPGVQVLDAPTGTAMAKKINDKLSVTVREHPKRFAGLASLAPQNPNEAADELERAVQELGLKGACINSHTKGEYLDDKKYWVILQRAERLGVPIYIHPRSPSPDMVKPYLSYPMLDSPLLGFSAEVALHALRLICSGVFDEYPKLKIILGHLGEALPYWLWRMDTIWQRTPLAGKLRKTPSEYIKDNFFVTTSGMFWQPPLLCSYLALGADRILFAVDYPLESNKEAVQFMDAAPICDRDKEKICHLNAEKLLGL
ncbi:2-keto-4-carboxy-3-hexenedioate hydratase [subsurface metagenome]